MSSNIGDIIDEVTGRLSLGQQKQMEAIIAFVGGRDDFVLLPTVGCAIPKINLRELTCRYPSHIKLGAK